MTEAYRRRTTCRMCGSPRLDIVMRCEPTPCGDHYLPAARAGEVQPCYPMDVAICLDCALVQLPDVVNPELLYREYIYNTSISLGLSEHFDRYAARLADWTGAAPGSLVLDIGSNDGTLLRSFKARGFAVLGVDPARDQARRANAAGVPTENAFFTEALARELRTARGAAAIVTANNVFANVDDLPDLVAGIRAMLAPDGVFTFETGYVVDLVRHSVIDNFYHEHLSYFSVLPLERFFQAAGMELIDVEHVETKGGSLRGMVQLAGGPRRANREAIDRMAAAERDGGFDRPDTYRAFAARMDEVRRDLRQRLLEAKARGETIAGYGASVGVTTLLYYWGLDEVLSYLVDDNPARHGLLTPGHQLPVLPSTVLAERRPDWVVLLAWRYADPIMRRHEAYRQAGGRFLIPLPAVREP
ncbi:MAG: class I SAM-dependent methyltransferase [Vicinamibacterales bacterium]|nr:class I SAM-dependent methyltransferase [Vicinamibacterales bacterium]